MTAPAIIDPDLEQVIEDLQYTVQRIQQIEGQLLDADYVRRYPDLSRMLQERQDLRDLVALKGEKLNLAPRALSLIVIEANRVRSKARGRRSVPLDKLLSVIRIVSDAATRDRAEANADLIAVQERAKAATTRSSGLANAIAYLEASRS